MERAKEEAVTKPVQSVRLNPDAAMNAARIKEACFERAVEALVRLRRSRAPRVEARSLSGQGVSPGVARRRPDIEMQGVHQAQRKEGHRHRMMDVVVWHESPPIHKKRCEKASSRRRWSLQWS